MNQAVQIIAPVEDEPFLIRELEDKFKFQEGWEAGYAEAKNVLEWRERMAVVLGKLANFIFWFLLAAFVLLQIILATHKLGVEEGRKQIVPAEKSDRIGLMIERFPAPRK
jgi:hypothetical protein